MQRRFFIAAIVATTILSTSASSLAADIKTLELFGVPLKGAVRDQLRTAIKQNKLIPLSEDSKYWVDNYDVNGALDGASRLDLGYLEAHDKFAYAQYAFPSSLDTQQVGKIIKLVSSKYGRPSSQTGSYDLGEVTAKWNLPQGMQIEVFRGWPDTSTYLRYSDLANFKQMKAEIAAAGEARANQKAKAQSTAF